MSDARAGFGRYERFAADLPIRTRRDWFGDSGGSLGDIICAVETCRLGQSGGRAGPRRFVRLLVIGIEAYLKAAAVWTGLGANHTIARVIGYRSRLRAVGGTAREFV